MLHLNLKTVRFEVEMLHLNLKTGRFEVEMNHPNLKIVHFEVEMHHLSLNTVPLFFNFSIHLPFIINYTACMNPIFNLLK